MNCLEYWKESLSQGAEQCGVSLTNEQLDYLADTIQGSFENYDMCFGYDVADKNFKSESERELEKLKAEQEAERQWKLKTEPCGTCITTGIVKDVWGRDRTCDSCDGKGRC